MNRRSKPGSKTGSKRCCQRCKQRHLRCVWNPARNECNRCSEANEQCIYDSQYRFQHVSHVNTASSDTRIHTTLTHPRDQIWVGQDAPLRFVTEATSDVPADSPVTAFESHSPNAARDYEAGSLEAQNGPQQLASAWLTPNEQYGPAHNSPAAAVFARSPSQAALHAQQSTGLDQASPDQHQLKRWRRFQSNRRMNYASPASLAELIERHEPESESEHTSPDSRVHATAHSPIFDSAAHPALTRREAFLFQHYISAIAPWMDACDLLRRFELEVPRRAARIPMMLYAILALASRHQAILAKDTDDHESSFYHGRCLKLVIEALSTPSALHDDNLLATAVLVRVYEELDHSTDMRFHLTGTARLIAAIPDVSVAGGLAQAASWQALRQDIQVCLMTERGPSLDLTPFEHTPTSSFEDDATCANKAVLLFAQLLRLMYSTSADHQDQSWTDLESAVEHWDLQRSQLFRPLYEEPADFDDDRPFPILWLLNDPQVVALQYYHACKAFLELHKPSPQRYSHFHMAKQRRSVEQNVSKHLAILVGLAESNPNVENANFTAHHILRTCGYCISNSIQRTSTLEYLEHVQKLMGWNTEETQGLLASQWLDLDLASTR